MLNDRLNSTIARRYFPRDNRDCAAASLIIPLILCVLVSLILGAKSCINRGTTSGSSIPFSEWSLPAPSGLTAVPVSTSQIDLQWNNDPAADGFEIWRSPDGVTYTLLSILNVNTTSYSDTGLSIATTYYYRIRAFNTIGDLSDWSNIVTAYTTFNYAWLPPFAMISTGWAHTLARGTDGTLWAWGYNNNGQLGVGDNNNRLLPNQVGTETDWQTVGCGDIHTLALKADRTLWAWGSNQYGQLGMGDTQFDNWDPFVVERNGIGSGADSDWSQIGAGFVHTIAVKTNGTLWGWGNGFTGELGFIGGLDSRPTPTQLGTDSDWSAVAAGGDFAAGYTLALKTNRVLWPWGWNAEGQLGLGSAASIYAPTPVGTDSDWSIVVAGTWHSLGIKTGGSAQTSGGTLWAWGRNDYGQLGLGDTPRRYTPTQIDNATDWSVMSAGAYHTLALKRDGTLWSCGGNTYGQLGLGDLVNRNTLTQIGTDSDWYRVAAGREVYQLYEASYSVALKTDGTLWSWGNNAYGQLGLGDTINRNIPCRLGSPAPPTNLIAAVISSTAISLTWTDNSNNENGFEIYRSTDGVNYTPLPMLNADTTSYSDIGLTSNTTYYYRIRSFNTFGVSPYSNEANATLQLPPGAPAALTATALSYNQIALTWSSVANASGYVLERGSSATGPWTWSITQTATTYTNGGLSPSMTYYYQVCAYNSGGSSSYVTANAMTLPLPNPPNAPTYLTATAVSTNLVALTWTAVTNETGYKLYRSTDNVTFTQIATPTTTSYSDLGRASGTLYYYRITSYNAGGESSSYASANVTTLPNPPNTPTPLAAIAASQTQINLSWTNVASETGYYVYRGLTTIGYSPLTTVNADITTYSDSNGLTANTIYYYQVCAFNTGGSSGYASASAATLPNPPNTPIPLAAIAASQTQINLFWTNVASETGYYVYRGLTTTGYSPLATINADITTYSDSNGLTANTIYYYQVCAFNTGGSSGYASANATTLPNPPNAPAILTATAVSATQINLTWTGVTGEDGYKIYRSTVVNSFSTNPIATPTATATAYTDTGRASSTLYYYRITSYNAGGESSGYASASATTPSGVTAPPPPSVLTATAVSQTQINLTWPDVNGEDGYKIYTSTNGSNYALLSTLNANTTSYPDSGLSAGTPYYYRITAYNTAGESSDYASANATTVPNAPGILTATAVSAIQINLTWPDVNGEDGYKIYTSTNGSNYALLSTLNANTTSYPDTGLSAGTPYYYRITAYNTAGESGSYASANATTLLNPPNAPGSLIATVVSATQITLTWTGVTGEDGYKIYRSPDNITFNQIATPTATVTSYPDSGLSGGTLYYYRITSYNAAGESGSYASANATTAPSAPGALTATVISSTQISLSWPIVTGATGYYLERKFGVSGTYAQILLAEQPLSNDAPPSASIASYTMGYRFRPLVNGQITALGRYIGSGTGNTTVRLWNDTGTQLASVTVSSSAGWQWVTLTTPIAVTAGTFYRVGVDCTGYCWYRSYTFPVTKTYIYISSSVLCGSGFGFPNSIDTSNMYGWADVEFVPAGILIPITNDTYNDTTVTPSNTYYYQVRASNGGGYSGYSPEANVTTPPATPGALTATAISSSQINLSWTGVTGETGYEIERKTGYNGIYGPFGSTIPGTTTYTDTAVSIGNIYYYRVYAFNTGGSGGYSPEASMVTGGDWSKFTAGGPNSAIACKTNGTLWGLWTGSNIPYRIGTDADWSTVAACTNAMYLANDFSIFACKTNKTLWAWGANTSGQLGLGGTYGPPLGIPKSNR